MGIISILLGASKTSGPSFNGATLWRLYQNSNTRGGTDAFAWHMGSFGMSGFNSLNQFTAATTAMATSTPQRYDDPDISKFFATSGTYGIFKSYLAGQYIQIQFPTSVKVTSVQYRNTVGGQWAPTSIQVRSSTNGGATWVTRAVYTDNNSTADQVISVP